MIPTDNAVQNLYLEVYTSRNKSMFLRRIPMAPVLLTSAQCILLLLVFATQAHAYIDPATGSMVIQAILAAIAAAAVSIGIFWRRIKLFLAGLFGRKNDEQP